MRSRATHMAVWSVLGCVIVSAQTGPVASPGIVFRAAASAGATSKELTLTVNKPAGTMAGDMMIASIGFRPSAAVVTPPAGWMLVRRSDTTMNSLKTAAVNANSLAVYRKAAGASEPASYSWTFDNSSGSAGGILAFSGVDAMNPIDVEKAQNTAYSSMVDAPSVATTMPNTMLVTSHAYRTSSTWKPPIGMTEAVDARSDSDSAGLSMEVNYAIQEPVGPTGIRTATALGIEDDAGNAHTLALKPARSTQ